MKCFIYIENHGWQFPYELSEYIYSVHGEFECAVQEICEHFGHNDFDLMQLFMIYADEIVIIQRIVDIYIYSIYIYTYICLRAITYAFRMRQLHHSIYRCEYRCHIQNYTHTMAYICQFVCCDRIDLFGNQQKCSTDIPAIANLHQNIIIIIVIIVAKNDQIIQIILLEFH